MDDRQKLGERELDIMQVLWQLEKATIGEVHKMLLEQGEEVAYTTIQTMLNRLETKNCIARDTGEQPHRYRPLLKKSAVIGTAIQRIADRFFGDSTEELIVHLVERDLEDSQLERIQEFIDKQRRKGVKP